MRSTGRPADRDLRPGRGPAGAWVLPPGTALIHDSVVGSRFRAVVENELVIDGREALVPVVTGTAFPTGEHLFVADAEDELAGGFLLR